LAFLGFSAPPKPRKAKVPRQKAKPRSWLLLAFLGFRSPLYPAAAGRQRRQRSIFLQTVSICQHPPRHPAEPGRQSPQDVKRCQQTRAAPTNSRTAAGANGRAPDIPDSRVQTAARGEPSPPRTARPTPSAGGRKAT